MNTHLTLLDKNLHLVRYPEHLQHPSWQAWDSADEYLIEHIEQKYCDYSSKNIRIYNDDFGALACWFASADPKWFSDSFVAYESCKLNLANNHISDEQIDFHGSLSQPDKKADLVLIKVPKTTALLEQQLSDLQKVVHSKTEIIAAGKAKSIQKSTLALFEKYLGTTTTSLAKKKARLVFCKADSDEFIHSPYPTIWKTQNPDFEIYNLANVFARQQLDIGARLLLEHLPNAVGKKVLDMGCGNGILGLHLLHLYPDCRVMFVDESHMAIESARQNVMHNLPKSIEQCQFLVSNCLDQYQPREDKSELDLVLCNPPFHQNNVITDHIALQMFEDAKKALKQGGELRVVANRHLDYPKKLKRLFGGLSVVASNNKFSILSARKR